MPFYEINWSKHGTALIEADSEDEAVDFLYGEIYFEDAEIVSEYENRPYNLDNFDPVSLI